MSQIKTEWEVNGCVLELDLQDAETAERYEIAFDKMTEEEKLMPKDGKPSEQIRAYHKLFVNLYDNLFGNGTGIKILGEKANTRICNETYEDFLAFVAEQKNATLEMQNNMIDRYSPNRAQRRMAKK